MSKTVHKPWKIYWDVSTGLSDVPDFVGIGRYETEEKAIEAVNNKGGAYKAKIRYEPIKKRKKK